VARLRNPPGVGPIGKQQGLIANLILHPEADRQAGAIGEPHPRLLIRHGRSCHRDVDSVAQGIAVPGITIPAVIGHAVYRRPGVQRQQRIGPARPRVRIELQLQIAPDEDDRTDRNSDQAPQAALE
jgi:hypothetical protein